MLFRSLVLSYDVSAEHAGGGALRLLGHALTEVSGREGRVAFRNHPGREVRNEVQALQRHDARRHQVSGGEEGVLEESRHRRLAGRDGRKVVHLYAENNVEEQKYVETNDVFMAFTVTEIEKKFARSNREVFKLLDKAFPKD